MYFVLSLTCVVRGSTIQCAKQNTVWCSINDSGNITAEDSNVVILWNGANRNHVIRFTWRTTNNVETIPKTIFETFPAIDSLDLSIGLESISQSDFELASKLSTLILVNNKIRNLPSAVFSKATKITSIQLESNLIDNIQDYAFQGLNRLTAIELQFNSLPSVGRLAFAGANNIDQIDLSNNNILTIELGAFDLPNLKWISLIGNVLTTLPIGFIDQAPALTTLDLSDNRFTTVPEALFSNNSIDDLDLSWNPIDQVRFVEFAKIPKLNKLNLQQIGIVWPKHISGWSQRSTSLVTDLSLSQTYCENERILQLLSVFGNLEKLNLNGSAFSKVRFITKIKQYFPNITEVSIANTDLDCNWAKRHVDRLNDIDVNLVIGNNCNDE